MDHIVHVDLYSSSQPEIDEYPNSIFVLDTEVLSLVVSLSVPHRWRFVKNGIHREVHFGIDTR